MDVGSIQPDLISIGCGESPRYARGGWALQDAHDECELPFRPHAERVLKPGALSLKAQKKERDRLHTSGHAPKGARPPVSSPKTVSSRRVNLGQ